MRIGWATMGDLLTDPVTGTRLTQRERYRMIIEGAVGAEAAGFWSASVGEHHFCDYIVSAPPVVLAAMAERTTTVRLGTAVALGANNDPIRLAEDYATLDVISCGRVELVVGRGNLYEHTFTAFGQDPRRSRQLYDERMGLLVEALHGEQLQWTGDTRPPFQNFTTQPRPVQERVPVWVGGGSSVDSAEFAARAGLPLMLPGVLAPPKAFVPIVERYRELWAELGHEPDGCRVGTIAHTFVSPTSQEAFATAAPRFATYLTWVGELIAISTPAMAGIVKETSLQVLVDRGPTVCGSPEQVVDKMGAWRDTLGLDVYLAMCDLGGMPPGELQATLELMGSDVLPAFHGGPAGGA
jgi:alkanesulfonate monooxygenase SsuD/methylene tetrahydromethanopterin reductase-like flavin-dependent oxidoreductase (luciferase family)